MARVWARDSGSRSGPSRSRRHANRTTGGTTDTYRYLGATESVVAITTGANTTTAALDALGDRLAVSIDGLTLRLSDRIAE